jgi:hypothetical protein
MLWVLREVNTSMLSCRVAMARDLASGYQRLGGKCLFCRTENQLRKAKRGKTLNRNIL